MVWYTIWVVGVSTYWVQDCLKKVIYFCKNLKFGDLNQPEGRFMALNLRFSAWKHAPFLNNSLCKPCFQYCVKITRYLK